MAKSDAVWGIDIGQCSFKALRCRAGDSPGTIIADAFDFIAYPKILSQPGADPVELVRDAIKQFLSRNSVRGDRVAISVAGQNGLARFIKLPPVESKKIPDIVRYEARQQIPFDLADVVWDYQRMGGGAEEEGFALETEVGLFAMKREQVFRALTPFTEAGIEVDVVQLTPLALYNYLLFDQLGELPSAEEFDPDNPPPSTVILSMGTDATDLVVTNGFRVWQRSIPLGGSHFTKALTKDLKLTFAKAEHLKCNAATAQDPKALFQAMRPVFNDLLTEIQRSINYFTNIDRRAKIERVVALGNVMKMPGLRRYLSQSLGMEVYRVDTFKQMSGPEVLGAPAFKDNLLCYGVCYGLAVQGLGLGRGTLTTNLLPKEIVKDRFIRNKKPWAVAAAAMLLLGCTISYASLSLALGTVAEDTFRGAESKMSAVSARSSQLQGEETKVKDEFTHVEEVGKHLVLNVDNRILWLELLRAIDACLPTNPDGKQRPKEFDQRNELHVDSIEFQKVPALETWFQQPLIQKNYQPPAGKAKPRQEGEQASSVAPTDGGAASGAPGSGPTGPGWIVQIKGHHYHNPKTAGVLFGKQFVSETLMKKLNDENFKVTLPAAKKGDGDNGKKGTDEVSLAELGICYPVLSSTGLITDEVVPDPAASANPAAGRSGGLGGANQPTITLRRCDFEVQFAWIPTPPTKRLEKKLGVQNAEGGASQPESRGNGR